MPGPQKAPAVERSEIDLVADIVASYTRLSTARAIKALILHRVFNTLPPGRERPRLHLAETELLRVALWLLSVGFNHGAEAIARATGIERTTVTNHIIKAEDLVTDEFEQYALARITEEK